MLLITRNKMVKFNQNACLLVLLCCGSRQTVLYFMMKQIISCCIVPFVKPRDGNL